MRTPRFAWLAFAVALPLLAPPRAARAQPSDLARMLETLSKDSPADYTQVMRRFVAAAVKDDVDAMLAMTSAVTLEQYGRDRLRDLYARDTVPVLKRFSRIEDGGVENYVDDGKGTTGWIFQKWLSAEDGKRAPFQFIVLKENGEVRLASFGLWQAAFDAMKGTGEDAAPR